MFTDSFDLFLFVTEKKTTKQTISRCQEDRNVTQETNQKLINHTHVHSRHKLDGERHVYCDVIDECGFTQSL
jgi:hypothetical protein